MCVLFIIQSGSSSSFCMSAPSIWYYSTLFCNLLYHLVNLSRVILIIRCYAVLLMWSSHSCFRLVLMFLFNIFLIFVVLHLVSAMYFNIRIIGVIHLLAFVFCLRCLLFQIVSLTDSIAKFCSRHLLSYYVCNIYIICNIFS